jgi:hypothetical protein
MRLHDDGRYECLHCGEILDIPLQSKPQVTIRAKSGRPNVRSLELDGREIHACAILTPPPADRNLGFVRGQ